MTFIYDRGQPVSGSANINALLTVAGALAKSRFNARLAAAQRVINTLPMHPAATIPGEFAEAPPANLPENTSAPSLAAPDTASPPRLSVVAEEVPIAVEQAGRWPAASTEALVASLGDRMANAFDEILATSLDAASLTTADRTTWTDALNDASAWACAGIGIIASAALRQRAAELRWASMGFPIHYCRFITNQTRLYVVPGITSPAAVLLPATEMNVELRDVEPVSQITVRASALISESAMIRLGHCIRLNLA